MQVTLRVTEKDFERWENEAGKHLTQEAREALAKTYRTHLQAAAIIAVEQMMLKAIEEFQSNTVPLEEGVNPPKGVHTSWN